MSEEIRKQDDSENNNLDKVEKILIESDPNIFDGISKQKKQQIIKIIRVTLQKTRIGPLPAPETFSEYSNIIPNGAERIMQMAEKQLDHRMKMENKIVGSQIIQSNIGQVLAFLIGIAALSASTYCIVTGHEWSSSIICMAV